MRMGTESDLSLPNRSSREVLHYIDPALSEGAMCSQRPPVSEDLGRRAIRPTLQWWTSFDSFELLASMVITRARNTSVHRGRKFEETSAWKI